MSEQPVRPPPTYEMFKNGAPGAPEGLAESLARTERWFQQNGTVHLLVGEDLHPVTDQKKVRALIAMGEIPIRDINGTPVPMDKINKFSIPANIYESFNILAKSHFPEIKQLVRLPSVKIVNGQVVPATHGYDAASGIFYFGGSAGLIEADPSYPHVKKWLTGLNFVAPVHQANTIGLTAACFARCALRAFPLVFIDANTKSSGKTTLAKAIGIVLTGDEPPDMSYTGDEHMFESKLTGYVDRPGPNYIFIDNIKRKAGLAAVKSMTMARGMNSNVLWIRPLYKEQRPIYGPIFAMTMNDGAVEEDLGDKMVPIRLVRTTRQPNRLLDPDPLQYAFDHRKELVAEFMSLLNGIRVHTDNHDGRCFFFNSILYGVTEKLGLKASLRAEDIPCPAALLQELIWYTKEPDVNIEIGQTIDLQKAVSRISTRPDDYKELNRQLKASGKPMSRRGAELGYWIFHNHSDPFLFDGEKFVIDVSSDFQFAALQKISPSA